MPQIIKEKQKITTCNWLDLATLGFRPIMPKISLDTHAETPDFILTLQMPKVRYFDLQKPCINYWKKEGKDFRMNVDSRIQRLVG